MTKYYHNYVLSSIIKVIVLCHFDEVITIRNRQIVKLEGIQDKVTSYPSQCNVSSSHQFKFQFDSCYRLILRLLHGVKPHIAH